MAYLCCCNAIILGNLLYYEIHECSPAAEWMVFIHGAGGSLATWKYQVRGFRGHYNLLLLDLRDHGNSKDLTPQYDRYDFDLVCDDILRTLDHLKFVAGHFLALSLGSIILQRLSERRPSMLLSMIMAGGVFKADWRIHLFAHTGKFFSHFVPFRWIYDIFILIVLPRANHRNSRRLYRLQSRKLTPKEFLKWLGIYRDFFRVVRAFFRRHLTTPSLIVMGSQDHVFLNAARRYTQRQSHLAQLEIIHQCGHLCNLEAAKTFNAIVLAYLGGQPWPTLTSR